MCEALPTCPLKRLRNGGKFTVTFNTFWLFTVIVNDIRTHSYDYVKY